MTITNEHIEKLLSSISIAESGLGSVVGLLIREHQEQAAALARVRALAEHAQTADADAKTLLDAIAGAPAPEATGGGAADISTRLELSRMLDAANARIAELEGIKPLLDAEQLTAANTRAEAAERARAAECAAAHADVARLESEAAALRAALSNDQHNGARVLALSTENAELRAEVERLTAQSREGWAKAGWNAGGEELAESRLAAANALLERCKRYVPNGSLNDDMRAHLRAQPATAPYVQPRGKAGQVLSMSESFEYVGSSSSPLPPAFEAANQTRTESDDYDLQAGGTGLSLNQVRAMYPAATRTEAEQRVLDVAREFVDRMGAGYDKAGFTDIESALWDAELARRRLKP